MGCHACKDGHAGCSLKAEAIQARVEMLSRLNRRRHQGVVADERARQRAARAREEQRLAEIAEEERHARKLAAQTRAHDEAPA